MAKTVHVVKARWDSEVRRWWAVSDDIPGLVTEAVSLRDVGARARAVAPELLAAARLPRRPIIVVAAGPES